MHYKNSIEAVSHQLQEIAEDIAKWQQNGPLRNIDLDLALNKIRNLYDLMLTLRAEERTFLNNEIIHHAQETIQQDKKTEALIIEKEKDPEKKPEAAVDKPVKFEKENLIEPATSNLEKDKSLLSEKFHQTRPTLNEELSSHVSSSDLAKQLKNKPITNLSSAIGLNEKFELIHNLFIGDKQKYEQTIEALNHMADYQEALDYLSNVAKLDLSQPLVHRLLELLQRKLMTK
ncbi:MAG: hypothetical protein IPM71_11035 [Bacteroidota bacterium]|nr:MAG: hypothetical protein IPM71_11035 [Bacteroidota bacterium]